MGRIGVLLLAIAIVAVVSACAGSAVAPGPTAEPTAQLADETIVFSFRGNVYAVRPDGPELQKLIGPDNEAYSAPEFSPDGRQLAYIVDRKRVVVVETSDVTNVLSDIDLFLDQAPPTPIASDFSMGPIAVHWSPDGTMLLVTRQRLGGSGASDVLLMNVSGTDLRILLDAGLFIEATWWREPDGTVRVLAVNADAGMTANTYDLDGELVGRGLPAAAMRPAVASLQHPNSDSVLVRSTLGSPELFGPIEVEDAEGPRIVAQGCGAIWSPDGEQIAFYNGDGIAITDPDAPPDDVELVVTNADLDLKEPPQLQTDGLSVGSCFGLGISWSANAPVLTHGSANSNVLAFAPYRDDSLGIEFDLPDSWNDGAGWMPYASCVGCLVIGPADASPPYGMYIFQPSTDVSGPDCGGAFGGCPVASWFSIRALTDGPQESISVVGHRALQQRMFRQPPLGLTNDTGELRLYREIATEMSTDAGGLLIVGFYREDDDLAKLEVEAAYQQLLDSLVVQE